MMIFIIKKMININRIITEAIDKAVLKTYSQNLEKYQGVYGLDPTPVAANNMATKFVASLNDFTWQVQDAINTNNYRPGRTGTSTRSTQSLINNNGIYDQQNQGKISSIVNNTADIANDVYGVARQFGFNGLDPLVGGTVTAFQNNYNDMRNRLMNKDNEQPINTTQKRKVTRQKRRKTGIDLTTLMGNDYRTLLTNYNYVNTSAPNLLLKVRYLKEVMTTLEEIKKALSTT